MILFLVLVEMVCVVLSEDASKRVMPRIESERRERVHMMLQIYTEEHDIGVIMNESKEKLCQRKFVTNFLVGTNYGTCEAIGNSFARILSNLVFAVVTNRTFVSYHLKLGNCFGHIALSPWIMSMETLAPLLESAGCPFEQAKYIDTESNPPCGFFDDSYRLLSNNAYWQDLGLQATLKYDKSLSQLVQNRSDLLFGSPYDDYAQFESYGQVAAHGIVFSKEVHGNISHILRVTNEIKESIRISIHLRHKPGVNGQDDVDADKRIDTYVLDALDYVRHLHLEKACYVYMASDRNESLTMVHDHAATIGCISYSFDKNDAHVQKNTKEHGPWAMGLAQFGDLLLLSHGDYFIGTWDSTYSHLAADLLAAHVFHKGGFYNPLVWVNSDIPERVRARMNGEFSTFFNQVPINYEKWNCEHAKGMTVNDLVRPY